MFSRDLHIGVSQKFAAEEDIERRRPRTDIHTAERVITRGRSSERDRPDSRALHGLGDFDIVAVHDGAVGFLHEFREVVDYHIHRLEIVGMVHIDVENDGQGGVEIEERAHILARLEDEALAPADYIAFSRLFHPRSAEDGRLAARRLEDGRRYRRRRALSVHSGDADPDGIVFHYITEEIGARDKRFPELSGASDNRVVGAHRDGVDDDVGVVGVFRRGRVSDPDPLAGDLPRQIALGAVVTGHVVTAQNADLGERTHGDPADAREKYLFRLLADDLVYFFIS